MTTLASARRKLTTLATLVVACGGKTSATAAPTTPLDVRPIAAASSSAPSETELSSGGSKEKEEELQGMQTDGPFASLALYCKWFKRDCRPGDARLCRCDVENAGPNAAVVKTRDLNREDANGMFTDFTAIRPAFHRSDGWRVAAEAPQYQEGAETSAGGSRTRAQLERASSVDVLGDSTLEEVFVLRLVHEEWPPGAKGWSVDSSRAHVVICGDAKGGYCTTTAIESDAVPPINKAANGSLIVGAEKIDDAHHYRLVVAPLSR